MCEKSMHTAGSCQVLPLPPTMSPSATTNNQGVLQIYPNVHKIKQNCVNLQINLSFWIYRKASSTSCSQWILQKIISLNSIRNGALQVLANPECSQHRNQSILFMTMTSYSAFHKRIQVVFFNFVYIRICLKCCKMSFYIGFRSGAFEEYQEYIIFIFFIFDTY